MELVQRLPQPPPRPGDAHKGTFGSALIVAGSKGMSGAAVLAGRAALHGGAGLVRVAIPVSVSGIVASMHPSYMTVWLEEDSDGRISDASIPTLEAAMVGQNVVAIGPGLGQSPGVSATVRHVYESCSLPMVVDADGLNAFAGAVDQLKRRPHEAARVLTPHPGEFSRLSGLDVATIQADRSGLAADFANDHEVILVLKGAGTVITDGRRIAINSTGNVGLAKGGSGDVLTGLIAALIAQGMMAFDAAQLGVYLHGLAADCAAKHHSHQYMTSVELLQYLDSAWQEFKQH